MTEHTVSREKGKGGTLLPSYCQSASRESPATPRRNGKEGSSKRRQGKREIRRKSFENLPSEQRKTLKTTESKQV